MKNYFMVFLILLLFCNITYAWSWPRAPPQVMTFLRNMNGSYYLTNGDVGIGTNNPGATLEVNGSLIFTQFSLCNLITDFDGNVLCGNFTNVTALITASIPFTDVDNNYIYNNSGVITLNETKLNETIISNSNYTSGNGNITIINRIISFVGNLFSGKFTDLDFSGTTGFSDLTDDNTLYNSDEVYINEVADTFYLNESKLNNTISAVINTTPINANNVQDIWVNQSGDTMTGNLNMSNNSIMDIYFLGFANNETFFRVNINDTNKTLQLWVNGELQQDWGHSTTIYQDATFLDNIFGDGSTLLNVCLPTGFTVSGQACNATSLFNSDGIWILNIGGNATFNESKLNETIKALDTQKGTVGPYLYNDSQFIYFDEAVLNTTISQKISSTSHVYRANNCAVLTGTLAHGNTNSTYFVDGNIYNITEVTGIPGFDIRCNFTNASNFNGIQLYEFYDGSLSHEINIQLWNYNTSTWDSYGTFTDEFTYAFIFKIVPSNIHYIQNGNTQIRLYHTNAGVNTHHMLIDYFVLTYNSGSVSSGLSGVGTADYIVKWLDSTSLGNSIMKDNETVVTVNGDLVANNLSGNLLCTHIKNTTSDLCTIVNTDYCAGGNCGSLNITGNVFVNGNATFNGSVYITELNATLIQVINLTANQLTAEQINAINIMADTANITNLTVDRMVASIIWADSATIVNMTVENLNASKIWAQSAVIVNMTVENLNASKILAEEFVVNGNITGLCLSSGIGCNESLFKMRAGASPYLYNDSSYIYLNDSYLNLTVQNIGGVGQINFTINVSGGSGIGQSNYTFPYSAEILRISVFPTTSTNNYRFSANTSITGDFIDLDKKVHVGNWIVAHDGSTINNEAIVGYITNANIDEIFTVVIKYYE